MTLKTKVLWLVASIFVAMHGALAWNFRLLPSVHFHGPLEGRVVDSGTGLPLRGVVITANWESRMPMLAGWRPGEQVKIMETVTDADGRFRLAGWGPVWIRRGVVKNEINPRLLLLRQGYEMRKLRNYEYGLHAGSAGPEWNGADIALRAAGPASLDGLKSATLEYEYLLREPAECRWRHVPRTFAEFRRAREALPSLGIPASQWETPDARLRAGADDFRVADAASCPDPLTFLAE